VAAFQFLIFGYSNCFGKHNLLLVTNRIDGFAMHCNLHDLSAINSSDIRTAQKDIDSAGISTAH